MMMSGAQERAEAEEIDRAISDLELGPDDLEALEAQIADLERPKKRRKKVA